MRSSLLLGLVLTATAAAAQAAVDPGPDARFAAPACREVERIDEPTSNDEGRLRAEWRRAIQKGMADYDAVMTGARAAYTADVTIAGRSYGPFYGIVKMDAEAPGAFDLVLRLVLGHDTTPNFHIGIFTSAPRRTGVFVVRLDDTKIECAECLKIVTKGLSARHVFEREAMSIVLPLPPGAYERPDPVHVPVKARIVLRRLSPSEIDLRLANVLFPRFQESEGNLGLVRPLGHDIVVRFDPPPSSAKTYPYCEAALARAPEIDLDLSCPATWRVRFDDVTVRRRCCNAPIDHGPPGSTPRLAPECITIDR